MVGSCGSAMTSQTNQTNRTSRNKQSSAAVRQIGETSRICQLNVEGVSRSKCEYISKFAVERNLKVLLLQETHSASAEDLDARGKIDCFHLVVAEHSSVHGIATYVKQGIPGVSVVESCTRNNVYRSVVRLGKLSITNVYKSPQVAWADPPLHIQPHPALYAGDFNSHHTEWGYRASDENGETIMNWATMGELMSVHDGKDLKTFHSKIHHTESNPDLCFVSGDSEGIPLPVTREVLPAFPNSQHRPVIIEVGLSIPIVTSVPRPRWNFQKANWNQFSRLVNSAVRFIPPLQQNYNRFSSLVISTAKKCVPRGYRKEYIPCWNEDSDRLYAEFNESENPDTAKELLKSLDEARKQRWVNTVENIDLTRSSRKGWSLIRKLGGASKLNNQKPEINADRIARRVVRNSKDPSRKFFTSQIIRAYRRLRRNIATDSELTRPFSVDDVNVALMYMKNGKASGFDAVYPEFLTFSGKRTRLWLARFFSNILQWNMLPAPFKRAKIISLLKPGKPANMPESYRSISLLSITFKLLERLLYNRIAPAIEKLILA